MSKTVVHLARRYPPNKGGVETHLFQLNKELLTQGWTIKVICLQTDPAYPLHQSGKIEVFRIPAGETKGLKHKLLIWSWIYGHKDIFINASKMHVHDIFWWILPMWFVVRKKIYTTFHGWEGVYPVPLKNKLHRLIAAKMSVATIHVGAWIEEFYWDKPTKITYGGAKISQEKKLKETGPSKKLQLVFLGRLEEVNEVSNYLQLIKQLKKTYPQLAMTWVGDGTLAAECRKVGKVTGMVDNPQKWIQKADFVFANSYLSIAEAQAQAKIVCAFYSHRLKQRYLETHPAAKNMILSNNIRSIEKEILELMSNKNLFIKKSQQSRKLAKQMTWKKVAQTYEYLWQKPKTRN